MATALQQKKTVCQLRFKHSRNNVLMLKTIIAHIFVQYKSISSIKVYRDFQMQNLQCHTGFQGMYYGLSHMCVMV